MSIISRSDQSPKDAGVWPHRLAILLACATFPLLFIGGLVTSKGAGLAVPDWPTTFGYNMFLYPWSKMVGNIFYEHSHRLVASGVGLLTIALTLALWFQERRHWLRRLGVAALLLVILQGVIGGLRVVLLENTLAIVHAAFAQAFFALTVSLAIFTSPDWSREPNDPPIADGGRLSRLCAVTTGLIYLQSIFGAVLRHTGERIDAHLFFALLVTVHVIFILVRTMKFHARSTEVDLACVLSGGAPASATDARCRIVSRKVHVDAWIADDGLGHSNHDAHGDWGADAGDQFAVNAKSVPLFNNCQGVHRSKNINGAVFRMNLNTDTVAITGASALRRLADFFELTKPRIVLMVLVTAFVGFYVGSEKIPDYLRLLQMLLGTALAAGGTLGTESVSRARHRRHDGTDTSSSAARWARATARGGMVWDRYHNRRARLSGSGREYRERVGHSLDYPELSVLAILR